MGQTSQHTDICLFWLCILVPKGRQQTIIPALCLALGCSVVLIWLNCPSNPYIWASLVQKPLHWALGWQQRCSKLQVIFHILSLLGLCPWYCNCHSPRSMISKYLFCCLHLLKKSCAAYHWPLCNACMQCINATKLAIEINDSCCKIALFDPFSVHVNTQLQ